MNVIKVVAILIGMCAVNAHAQQNGSMLLDALNHRIFELKSFDSTDTSEFSMLKKEISGFKVIGLGEATHGTREFYLYKAKLIKYLVEHQGLRVLVFESDMVGMESINDYVLNKAGLTLEKAMSNYGLFDIYRTQEVADLIQWIKAFNLNQPADDRVIIAGMDANMPHHIASKILQSKSLSPHLGQKLKEDLADIRSMPERRDFGQAKKKYLLSIADRLAAIVQDKLTPDSLEIYSHYIHLLVQSLRMINLDDIQLNTQRDAHMAENVLWLLNKTTDKQTLAIWGHNGHICTDKWRGYKSTGMHLHRKLKSRYYALGLAVGEGYARLWDSRNAIPFHKAQLPAIQNTSQFEFVLKQLKYSNSFLPTGRGIEDKTLRTYFSKPLLTRALGAQVVRTEQDILLPIRVDRAYDGVVFFKQTTNAAEIVF
ncbi:erythromycin esterase family protein [Pedobacter frigoris]|uniref:Erythromycin esterase family protein n=1 Tax=Pedobacter frigoris TaxID=2571272 RepID=A0A4U1CL01_9SPHI|nr:erythromycin esterase family protein [Pedobacter frigoris]TKC07336.1 erythromycin esterase family protein [Pedobacter frigoris]